jgi:heme A synthase
MPPLALSFIQILVGLGMYILDLPPVLKVLHLWSAAVMFALLVAMYRALSTTPGEA